VDRNISGSRLMEWSGISVVGHLGSATIVLVVQLVS
jgi:hypothetical protein